MKLPAVLPESMLKCLSPDDRRALGVAGWTKAECAERAEAKNERQLQQQIIALLRRHGIEPLWHRTDKKSAATVGWPDITFAIADTITTDMGGEVDWPKPCAWEVKFGDGQLSTEQQQMAVRLQSPPNCWSYRVIRSYDEALKELSALGIT